MLTVFCAGAGAWTVAQAAGVDTLHLRMSIAAAAAALAVSAAVRTWSSGVWFALAVMGHAATLEMINAGTAMRYQHFKELPTLLRETSLLLLGVFVLQTAVVGWGLFRRRTKIKAWLVRWLRPWQLGLLGLTFILTSATVSERVDRYLLELAFAAVVQAVNLGNLLLVAMALPEQKLIALGRSFRLDEPTAQEKVQVDRYAVIAAAWVFLISTVFAVVAYERHPHIPDEVVYLQHARLLASGHLTAPVPLVPEAFELYLMKVDGDRWFPTPPPGWPAILAVGAFFNLPWLVNPILAALNAVLAYLFLGRIYDVKAARIGLGLICVSPWFLFMGMNFMTHMATLSCALVAGLCVLKLRDGPALKWGLTAGAFTGLASLIRPLDGAILGLLVVLWILVASTLRSRLGGLVSVGLGIALIGGLALPYNYYLTGDPARFPINAYVDDKFGPGVNSLGFGPNRGMGWAIDPYPGHSPLDALVNANLNTFSLNIELFGWSLGSLIFAALFVLCGKWRRSDWMLLAVVGAVFTTHFFYYFSGGPDFGARYWFLMFVPLIGLTVGGLRWLVRRLETPQTGAFRLAVFLLCASLCTLVNFLPWRATDKYHSYLDMSPEVSRLAEERNFGKSLVLVRGKAHPDYASAAAFNPVDLSNAVPVYAWDRGPDATRRLREAYPDRPMWIVTGPSVTGKGYEIVAGPVWPHNPIARHSH